MIQLISSENSIMYGWIQVLQQYCQDAAILQHLTAFHPLAQFSSGNSSLHDRAQQLKVYIFPGPFPVEKENIPFTISSISHAPVLEKSLWSGRWADLSKAVLLPSLRPQRSFRLCEMRVRGGKSLQKGN